LEGGRTSRSVIMIGLEMAISVFSVFDGGGGGGSLKPNIGAASVLPTSLGFNMLPFDKLWPLKMCA
jgi:hypothetical protein